MRTFEGPYVLILFLALFRELERPCGAISHRFVPRCRAYGTTHRREKTEDFSMFRTCQSRDALGAGTYRSCDRCRLCLSIARI